MPIAITNDEPTPYGYLSTFVAIQRVGKRPVVASDVAGFGTANQAVYIPTLNDLPAREMDRLLAWVRQGGNLYLLDGGLSSKLQMSRFVRASGAAILPIESPSLVRSAKRGDTPLFFNGEAVAQVDVISNGKSIGKQIAFGYIQGGKPLLLNAANSGAIAAELPLGKGHLILTTTLFMFSDQSLGDVKAIPTDQQLAAYQVLFQWYGKGQAYNKAINVRPPQEAAAAISGVR